MRKCCADLAASMGRAVAERSAAAARYRTALEEIADTYNEDTPAGRICAAVLHPLVPGEEGGSDGA